MVRKGSPLLGGILVISALAACDSTSTDQGVLKVRLAGSATAAVESQALAYDGAPFPFDSVAAVKLHVTRIEVKREDADSAEAELNDETEDAARRGGWLVVAKPDSVIDLLKVATAPLSLGEQVLPQGTYQSFRVVIDASRSSVTLKDGTVLPAVCNSSGGQTGPAVFFPSACTSGIKIRVNPLQVEDTPTTLTVDFDVSRNFRANSSTSVKSGGLRFTPVVRATVTKG